MAGQLLNTAAVLMCAHGGRVVAQPGSPRVMASGAPVLRRSDRYLVAGCPFTTPAGTPNPCVQVSWLAADTQVQAGDATLSTGSQGLCLSAAGVPQGPVQIVSTPTRVDTR